MKNIHLTTRLGDRAIGNVQLFIKIINEVNPL